MMLRKALRSFAPVALRGVHGSTAVRAEAALEHQSRPTGKKKLGFSAIILFLPCVATFGLGTWQVFRRQWKADLLEYKRKRLGEEPVSLRDALKNAEDSEKSTPELEYRRVVCEGKYDEGKSIFLGPRMKNLYGSSQRGYYIFTPLYPISSSSDVQQPVLVNRGWVPTAWREDFEKGIFTPTVLDERFQKDKIRTGAWWKTWWKAKPSVEIASEANENGGIKVCGVVRTGENPNMFVPLNDPEHGQWFYIDIPAMLKATGLPENSPYIEAVAESPPDEDKITFPVPKEIEDFVKTSLMPNDHLTYAFTWYTLSAATTYMAVKRVQDKPVWKMRKLR